LGGAHYYSVAFIGVAFIGVAIIMLLPFLVLQLSCCLYSCCLNGVLPSGRGERLSPRTTQITKLHIYKTFHRRQKNAITDAVSTNNTIAIIALKISSSLRKWKSQRDFQTSMTRIEVQSSHQ
jgi:hypothetical protein